MSVLIKSNKVATNSFGTLKMQGTTAETEFEKYKSRVTADGGVVNDEQRTLEAFIFMFRHDIYGLSNTFVSGSFGAKVDASGGVLKLYAIDGMDLNGITYGSGTLPKILSDGSIDFSSNNPEDAINLGMFTSDKSVMSISGSFAFMFNFTDVTSPSGVARHVAALTDHNDSTNIYPAATVFTTGSSSVSISSTFQPSPLDLSTVSHDIKAEGTINSTTVSEVTVVSTPETSDLVIYSNQGVRGSVKKASAKELSSKSLYIDFGGAFFGSKKSAYDGKVRDFASFKHISQDKGQVLSVINF